MLTECRTLPDLMLAIADRVLPPIEKDSEPHLAIRQRQWHQVPTGEVEQVEDEIGEVGPCPRSAGSGSGRTR